MSFKMATESFMRLRPTRSDGKVHYLANRIDEPSNITKA